MGLGSSSARVAKSTRHLPITSFPRLFKAVLAVLIFSDLCNFSNLPNFIILFYFFCVYHSSFFGCRVNVSLGPREERLLVSGLHTVNDIYCSSCQQLLGWRYVSFSSLLFSLIQLGSVLLDITSFEFDVTPFYLFCNYFFSFYVLSK